LRPAAVYEDSLMLPRNLLSKFGPLVVASGPPSYTSGL
jgi:hypothetical protein